MDGTNPKVSFIPKGSLVREESFLERRRPRSVIGFIAIFAFIISAGSYAGLSYYGASLDKEVGTKTDEIKQAQKIFSDAPQVGNAKLFRARADLARELLAAHSIISPVFAFISKNTVASILYNKFSFLKNINGDTGPTLELTGEAPTYATLAYQSDILKSNTKELSGFSIQNVVLTQFGTITFTLDLAFAPDYLSYARSSASAGFQDSQTPMQVNSPIITTPTAPVAPTTIFVPTNNASATDFNVVPSPTLPPSATTTSTTSNVRAVTSPQQSATASSTLTSFWNSLWARFKFW